MLKIPSFQYEYKNVLDSIVLANQEVIASASAFIIDLSGNTGGSDGTYEALLPYVYSAPVTMDMVEFWTSPDNIKQFQDIADDTTKPEAIRLQCRELAGKMKAQPNAFVNVFGKETGDKAPDTIYDFPKRVAILVDKKNASSAEQFLLETEQSTKVITFGKGNTSGTLDYSNLYFEYLPSENRAVSIPTSRSLRVRKQPFDAEGFSPKVKIPAASGNQLAFIIDYLGK